jgi:hypothetical protein
MSEDPIINGQPLSALKVVDLRRELDTLGLSKSGNKKELFERLRAHLNSNEDTPTEEQPVQPEEPEHETRRATRSSASPKKTPSPVKSPSKQAAAAVSF